MTKGRGQRPYPIQGTTDGRMGGEGEVTKMGKSNVEHEAKTAPVPENTPVQENTEMPSTQVSTKVARTRRAVTRKPATKKVVKHKATKRGVTMHQEVVAILKANKSHTMMMSELVEAVQRRGNYKRRDGGDIRYMQVYTTVQAAPELKMKEGRVTLK